MFYNTLNIIKERSEITNLTVRFWDIEQGAIDIGGKAVKTLSYGNLLKNVSCVFQDATQIGRASCRERV